MIEPLPLAEFSNEDQKLAELVGLCLKTHNYGKVARVAKQYITEEVARMLRQARFKISAAKEFSWVQVLPSIQRVNSYFLERFNAKIIPNDIVSSVADFNALCEGYHAISPPVLSLAFKIYFELRKIKVPNLKTNEGAPNLIFNKSAPRSTDVSEDIMVYELGSRKRALKFQLKRKYDPSIVEQILQLEKLENSQQINSRVYSQPESRNLRFFLLGALFVFASLTGLMFYERVVFPEVNDALALLSMGFAIFTVILSVVYYKVFYRPFRGS